MAKHLDLSNFPSALKSIETMSNAMRDIVDDINSYKQAIIKDWVGEGRNQFEKTYNVLIKKLKDGADVSWDMYEDLIAAQEDLEQTDVNISKAMHEE